MTKLKNLAFNALAKDFKNSVEDHALLIFIVILYIASAILTSFRFPERPSWFVALGWSGTALIAGPIFSFCAYTIYVMIFVRPARLTKFLINSTFEYLTASRIIYAAPVIILFPLFTSTFSYFKATIPAINPYSWDIQLSKLDLLIHGGVQPWTWLQSIFGHPAVTSTINFFYHIWFFVIFSSVYIAAFSTQNKRLRMQFLLSFVLSWILLGNIIAATMSSVGPCYYGFAYPDNNPYTPLMSYLHDANLKAPIWALDVQDMLWEDYKKGTGLFGISAMPSMHVATAVLLSLAGFKVSKLVGFSLSIFAVIIMIGSVHLGWHYAVDGYIGTFGAYIIWHGTGWLMSFKRKESKIYLSNQPISTSQL
jgi:hypothetical protein